MDDLLEALKNRYRLEGRRRLERLEDAVEHLLQMFRDVPAAQVKGADVLRYANLRLEENARPATINRELAALRAAYRRGLDNDTIVAMLTAMLGTTPEMGALSDNSGDNSPDAPPVFHPLAPPTDEEIAALLERVRARVQTLLRRRGRLPEEPSPSDPVAEQLPLLAAYAAASIQERVAAGPRAGHPRRRLRSAPAVVDADKPRCARRAGFSLHANVALPGGLRLRDLLQRLGLGNHSSRPPPEPSG